MKMHSTNMEDQAQENTHKESLERKHEVTDANARRVVITGIALLGIMLVGLLVSWGVFVFAKKQSHNPEAPAELFSDVSALQPPPRPWLQANPADTLHMIRRAEDSVLTSYGWIDKEHGIVRIPIDRAIELVAERGLPVRREEIQVSK